MKSPAKKSTLLFLIKDNEVLLAMKKRGFGKGRWNGVGGKPEVGEAIEKTAIRECREEIRVTPQGLTHVATLDFYFPEKKADWNQQVFVYFCREWRGEPIETEEMKPKWYSYADIPYENMWDDDKHWLPLVLGGSFVKAEFRFDNDDKILYQKITSQPIDT